MVNQADSLHPVLRNLESLGIVPVVVIDNPAQAGALGAALIAGGLPCAEITFRTERARDAIAAMHQEHPEMLVGAGTVLSVQQAQQALDAGASFIVAPGLNHRVVSYCVERSVPITPGIMTPTDIEAGLSLGLNVLKFFPAEAAGGLRFLKAVAAPYKTVRFVPTGGIDRSNFLPYLKFPRTLAVGGSWMVKAEIIRSGGFDTISEEVRLSVREMLDIRVESAGLDDSEVREAVEEFGSIIPLSNSPVGAESGEPSRVSQDKGALLLSTPFVDRVAARLIAAGIECSPYEGDPKRVILDRKLAGWTFEIIERRVD